MAKKPLTSPEVLRQLLRYEPETGKLFWKERGIEWFDGWGRGKQKCAEPEWRCERWNKRYGGREAGALDTQSGYVRVFLFDKHHYAHRVIWMMAAGPMPDGMEIDHENGVRSDNRLTNLRLVSVAENAKNVRLRENSSGVTGVFWCNQKGKWAARIIVGGEVKHLGFFQNLDDARLARATAESKFGFHENHGSKDRPIYRRK